MLKIRIQTGIWCAGDVKACWSTACHLSWSIINRSIPIARPHTSNLRLQAVKTFWPFSSLSLRLFWPLMTPGDPEWPFYIYSSSLTHFRSNELHFEALTSIFRNAVASQFCVGGPPGVQKVSCLVKQTLLMILSYSRDCWHTTYAYYAVKTTLKIKILNLHKMPRWGQIMSVNPVPSKLRFN